MSRVLRNLWMLVLDILAVNAAYYLGLVIRFSTNLELKPEAMDPFLPGYTHFAPYYTVICVIVFYLFRLYGGMWRYAGLNDMNRIIGACLTTTVIQVAGTLLFVMRMPISYYIIGAVLQFAFIVIIRFSYRFLLAEKQKIANKGTQSVATLVVGAGDMGRRAVQHFNDHTAFGVKVIYDEKNAGRMQDGIHVVGGEFADVLQSYQIEAICIADTKLTSELKKDITSASEDQGLELIDFSGKFSNIGGSISLTALLEMAEGPVDIVIDGERTSYGSGAEAMDEIKGHYEVVSIGTADGVLKIELKKPGHDTAYDKWMEKYKEETGGEVSFF